MNKKNILIISYGFPDVLSPAVFHVMKVVRSLAEMGHTITILTTETGDYGPKKDKDLIKMVPDNVRIIKVRSEEYYFGKIFKALGIKKNIYWPDIKFLWYLLSKKRLKRLLGTEKFDLIYSRAHPFTCHLIGAFGKELAGIPLVSHFSDPWLDGIYVPFSRKVLRFLYKSMEKKVLEYSDCTVFVNQYCRDLVLRKYPDIDTDKTLIIPHGYDRTLMPEIQRRNGTDRLRMVFAGDFYSSHRTPSGLFNALVKLRESGTDISVLEILFVGKTKDEYKEESDQLNLSELISFIGKVPYRKSFEFMNDADVLMIIDAPSKGDSPFLPSKLIDYIAFNKFVLGITPKRGAAADFINNIGGMVSDPGNIDEIAAAIKKCIEMHKNGEINNFQIKKQILDEYSCERTNQTLLKMFEEVIARGPGIGDRV